MPNAYMDLLVLLPIDLCVCIVNVRCIVYTQCVLHIQLNGLNAVRNFNRKSTTRESYRYWLLIEKG